MSRGRWYVHETLDIAGTAGGADPGPVVLSCRGFIRATCGRRFDRQPCPWQDHHLTLFGFAVTANGGTFVCSMAGPLTGGFKRLKVMTVEGPVAKGSLRVRGGTATFDGTATVVLVPGMKKEPVQILSNIPFTVTVGLGGPGKA